MTPIRVRDAEALRERASASPCSAVGAFSKIVLELVQRLLECGALVLIPRVHRMLCRCYAARTLEPRVKTGARLDQGLHLEAQGPRYSHRTVRRWRVVVTDDVYPGRRLHHHHGDRVCTDQQRRSFICTPPVLEAQRAEVVKEPTRLIPADRRERTFGAPLMARCVAATHGLEVLAPEPSLFLLLSALYQLDADTAVRPLRHRRGGHKLLGEEIEPRQGHHGEAVLEPRRSRHELLHADVHGCDRLAEPRRRDNSQRLSVAWYVRSEALANYTAAFVAILRFMMETRCRARYRQRIARLLESLSTAIECGAVSAATQRSVEVAASLLEALLVFGAVERDRCELEHAESRTRRKLKRSMADTHSVGGDLQRVPLSAFARALERIRVPLRDTAGSCVAQSADGQEPQKLQRCFEGEPALELGARVPCLTFTRWQVEEVTRSTSSALREQLGTALVASEVELLDLLRLELPEDPAPSAGPLLATSSRAQRGGELEVAAHRQGARDGLLDLFERESTLALEQPIDSAWRASGLLIP
ncbi:MAG: hypothetical protein IPN34_16930 [Planctomycetes bacterium]|nr:hypothetical protein [Planctomycetota bacterium]